MRFSSSVPYFVFLEKTTGAESSTYSFMCVGDVCTGDYEASNPRKKMREKLREITHNQLFSLSEKTSLTLRVITTCCSFVRVTRQEPKESGALSDNAISMAPD